MATRITRTDIVRLIRSLEWHRNRVTRVEFRSKEDLDFETVIADYPPDLKMDRLLGLQVIFNRALEEGTLRVFPDIKFSLCGMFSEWNVLKYGPVPQRIDFEERTGPMETKTLELG